MSENGLGTILCVLVVFSLLIIGCQNTVEKRLPKNLSCVSDTDCVPASCCHPNLCIHKNAAPNCKNTMCTAVCAPNSMDCGKGSCFCINNTCEAKINE